MDREPKDKEQYEILKELNDKLINFNKEDKQDKSKNDDGDER